MLARVSLHCMRGDPHHGSKSASPSTKSKLPRDEYSEGAHASLSESAREPLFRSRHRPLHCAQVDTKGARLWVITSSYIPEFMYAVRDRCAHNARRIYLSGVSRFGRFSSTLWATIPNLNAFCAASARQLGDPAREQRRQRRTRHEVVPLQCLLCDLHSMSDEPCSRRKCLAHTPMRLMPSSTLSPSLLQSRR